MRIIAGRLKGLKLVPVGGGDSVQGLRPTSAPLRKSIFDILTHGRFGNAVDGARVLDLFAGTGAMGIEAVSRGAEWATFVETQSNSRRIIRKNIDLACIGNCVELKSNDAAALGRNRCNPFDLVFADPPYGSDLEKYALAGLVSGNWLARGAVVVVEGVTPVPFPGTFEMIECRHRFGSMISMGVFSPK